MSKRGEKLHAASEAAGTLMGTNGAVIVSDTATYTGNFYSIQAISDTVVNEAVLDSSLIDGSLNGLTITAGTRIYLYGIESISLTSGDAVLHKM